MPMLHFLEDLFAMKSWTDVYDFVEFYFGTVPAWLENKAWAEDDGTIKQMVDLFDETN